MNYEQLKAAALQNSAVRAEYERQEKLHRAAVAAQAWNAFNDNAGSFADEHSTL